MSPLDRTRSQPAAAVVLIVLLAAAPLTGCGGSSKSASPASTSSGIGVSARKGADGGRGFNHTGATRRYTTFAACMRKHGVSLPAADTSGKGPIFDTKGLHPRSATFKAADRKCARELFPNGTTGR